MNISKNVKLAQYTTFKIGGSAKFFCIAKNEQDVIDAVDFAKKNNLKIMPLGGGSNILVSDKGFDGLVIKNEIMGIDTREDTGKTIISAGAGELWDDVVQFAVSKNLCGLENLSAIPGTVGAAPVQNIGAYGAEAGQFIYKVIVFDCTINKIVELDNRQCNFGYRNSLFKYHRHRYIILNVQFIFEHNAKSNISYKDLKQYFKDKNDSPSCAEVREAVIEIRKNKLPDWKKWGTAGSFFKNPIVSREKFLELKKQYPDLPGFEEASGNVKVSLGWILDKVCNAKGLKYKRASTYDKQALVIVSESGATAEEVVQLSLELINQVKDKTGITIESEVEWVA